MLFRNILAAVLSTGVVAALPAEEPVSKRSVDFKWGSQKVRGLNLGGWLVLEPWITPSIFKNVDQSLGIVDEFTLTEKLGRDAAYNILKPHWDTWCTFADFQKIAKAGFNTVRLPFGYWAYSLDAGEPYTQGAAPYVDAAIDWARETGLKVILDLHGAPGSQNGFDNSGHKSPPRWQQGSTTAQTLAVLKTISDKYAQVQYQDVVVAVELLNEPLSGALNFDQIKQFYRDGFNQVRRISDTPVMLHDAFVSPSAWNGFLSVSDNNAQNVIIDHHEYQVFTNDLVAMQPWQHRQHVCNNIGSYASGTDKWVVVGEWTGAMTDCAPALNGYGIGARYDGTYAGSPFVGSCADKNDIANWNQTFKDDMRGYIEAQLSAFESQTQGWVFWNFKTEGAHEWDAFKLLDNGIFPQPLTDRKFGGICSS
ncbi:probable EXG1 Exo-beta-1,3-glucanase (I/II), major isoform [Rhynchosporium secalis]|uniref:glucan 1,3-beta-glucosidase n=1 Tax=Rhynchosporium secalis TaxID=38038 RepID=A0A1E1MCH7_RHYSE|nr:probable EXG1 Exo-beta-1,3-glucanase (I/II), major isoform [Rhynchosporium secalis]